jgi:hypothetical protein
MAADTLRRSFFSIQNLAGKFESWTAHRHILVLYRILPLIKIIDRDVVFGRPDAYFRHPRCIDIHPARGLPKSFAVDLLAFFA